MLRYRRHHVTATGLASPKIAEEFLVHANAELSPADRLAARIVQLGGEPDFNPEGLLKRGHADFGASRDLSGHDRRQAAGRPYRGGGPAQMIALVADKDSTPPAFAGRHAG